MHVKLRTTCDIHFFGIDVIDIPPELSADVLAVGSGDVILHAEGHGQGLDYGRKRVILRDVIRIGQRYNDGSIVVHIPDGAVFRRGKRNGILRIIKLDGCAVRGLQLHLFDERESTPVIAVVGQAPGSYLELRFSRHDAYQALANTAARIGRIQGVVLKEIIVQEGDLHAVIADIDGLVFRKLLEAVLPVVERDFVIRSEGQGLAVERHIVHEFIRRMACAVVGEGIGGEHHLRLRLFDGELLAIVDVIAEVAHNGTFSRACIVGIPVKLPGGNVVSARVGMTAVVEGNIHTLQRSRSRGLHLVAQVIAGMPQGIAGIIRFAIHLAEVTELNFHVE